MAQPCARCGGPTIDGIFKVYCQAECDLALPRSPETTESWYAAGFSSLQVGETCYRIVMRRDITTYPAHETVFEVQPLAEPIPFPSTTSGVKRWQADVTVLRLVRDPQ